MPSCRRSASAALLALALLASPSLAQERTGDAQAPAAQPPRQEPQTPPRASEGQRDPQQQPADRPEGERAQPGQQPGDAPRGPGAGGDAPLRKLLEEEAKHRATLAKLERLRLLAEEKGQTERLAALADLLKKENDRYKAMREKARQFMGNDAFNALEERLASGRHRGQAGGRNKQPPGGQDPNRKPDAPRPDHPQGQQPPADRPKDQQPQGNRPKDQQPQGERPKGDAPKGDNRQGDSQQGGQRNGSPRG